ncbi:tetratricopeptide repeat protein [Haliangium ochraceum]|uniref:TPR repeat-containing protein n=1 Tax=Haliangium ochraceum (strain DSM 14365 / JCM 11303 / SMP-2) TaxID=502025 RepID=D0LGQ9_HALO1|nr:tetratricopeptide repeat protein [Haliangium ochraceum]ACY12805.1 TPR repeat-containing protein [Haliangium ochraceum DSM 14365]
MMGRRSAAPQRGRRIAAAAVFAAALALLAQPAAADLASGKRKLLRGDYAAARADLADVGGRDRAAAQLALARVEQRVGAYDAAEKRARGLLGRGDAIATDARVFIAELQRLTGRYADARRELEAVVFPGGAPAAPAAGNAAAGGALAGKTPSAHLRGRYLLGLVYADLGQQQLSDALFETFFDDWNSGRIDAKDAPGLLYLAQAARYRESFQEANDVFREAVGIDPQLLEANLAWGDMGLEKYAVALAEQSYDEVLKIDPNHPDAHSGMARVKLEQSYDLAAAFDHLEKALASNPRHLRSLLVRASLEIDQNQWDAAQATLAEVFAVNPMNFEGRALLATVHWLRDDSAAYEAERERVLAANPGYAAFYHIVARSAVREHRYREAIALEEQAVELDPDYHEAMQALGTGYLRLGDEERGLRWMRKSWQGDEYNVRTYNTLELFENELPKEYGFVQSKYFKYRYPNEERTMLRRYVEPLLERAFEDMVARYGFRPEAPLIIELFHNPEHYSVRTVGLPNLGALGVCFGHVITAMSPAVGEINWGMVLWHELAHVFAIQMSNSRVPRWYTEGLSEYETLRARPEWRRENDADLYAALADGTLPSVAELNYSFMRPSMQQVMVAYYQSAVTMEYIVETHGFDKVLEGLRLFGQGKETPEVIELITGHSVADFDTAFRAYLRHRLAPYRGSFRVPTEGFDDLDALRAAARAAEDDADAQAALALGHFYQGDAPGALQAAGRALELMPAHHLALYVSAEVALRQRDVDTALEHFRALIRAGGDSFDVRGRLGMIARLQDDLDEAIRQLCAAKRLDPERSYPYSELYDVYKEAGRMDEALAELETYVMLEQMQYGPLRELVGAYAERARWDKVRVYGEMAVHINPSDAELFLMLGQAYLETGDPAQALFTFDSALLAKPALRRPALAHIGKARAHLARRQRRPAAAELRSALQLEPENAEALELRRTMR